MPTTYNGGFQAVQVTPQSVRQRLGMYFGSEDHQAALMSALHGSVRHVFEGGQQPDELHITLTETGWLLRASGEERVDINLEHWLLEAMACVGGLDVDCQENVLEMKFEPEPGVFGSPRPVSSHRVVGALRPIALAHPGTSIVVSNADGKTLSSLDYSDATALALELGGSRSHRLQTAWRVHATEGNASVDAAIWWAQDGGKQEYAVVNGYHTSHDGDHIKGFWTGWVDAVAQRAREAGWPSNCFDAMKAPAGLHWNATLVLSVRWPDPTWGPATRCCLNEPDCGAFVRRHTHAQLLTQLRAFDPNDPTPPWQMLGGIHRKKPWLACLNDDFGEG